MTNTEKFQVACALAISAAYIYSLFMPKKKLTRWQRVLEVFK